MKIPVGRLPRLPAHEVAWIPVLHISHKHGDTFYLALDEASLRARLAEWARDWWDDEGVPGTPPKDDDQAIARYFEQTGDHESYVIDEAPVLDWPSLPDPKEVSVGSD